MFTTPNSTSAAQLIYRLEAADQTDVQMAGATIEDVFLNLTNEVPEQPAGSDGAANAKGPNEAAPPTNDQLEATRDPYSFFSQVWVLMRKRFAILLRYWVAPILCLLIPCLIIPKLQPFLKDYERPQCVAKVSTPGTEPVDLVYYVASCLECGISSQFCVFLASHRLSGRTSWPSNLDLSSLRSWPPSE